MCPNDAEGIANSADRDQTAPLGAVWSGSVLFAQAYVSENLGSLRYNSVIEQTNHFDVIYFLLWTIYYSKLKFLMSCKMIWLSLDFSSHLLDI